jgi:Zn-dependent M28 family amino/carboxypeptidase
MRFRLLLVFTLLCSISFAQYPGAKTVPGAWRSGFESIREQDAREILGHLAGKELKGRGSLSPEFLAAADYVANELKQLGLKPAGDNGTFLQHFEYVRATPVPEGTSLESGAFKLAYGPEFQANHEADVDAKVRFAFLNIPEKADLTGLNWSSLKGRIVVYTAVAPRNAAFNAQIGGARETYGVEAMILASSEQLPNRPGAPATGIKGMPDPRESQIGTIRLSADGARNLAAYAGATKFLDSAATQASIELPGQEFSLKIKTKQESFPLVNVLAKLEGSDDVLKKQAVVLGSHLDHMGEQRGNILYGADDNASGCTANLMIAKAMVGNRTKPKRTILFAFWAAEEIGTFGSFAYAVKPAIPHADTVAYINMDMLGRDEDTGPEIAENNRNVVYPGTVLTTSKDFYERLLANNAYVGLRFKPDRTDRTNRSDTRNFVWKNVPTVKIFTGEHPDYHRAGDTIEKINWTKLVNITKWLYLTAADLANSPSRPRFEKQPFIAPEFLILSGRATFLEKIMIPFRSKLRVGLYEVGSSDPVATKDFPTSQNRTPYELLVPKASLKPEAKYELRMEILDGTRVLFSSPTPIEVPIAGWTRAKDVELKMAAGESPTLPT